MRLEDWWEKITLGKAEKNAYFQIDNDRVLNTYTPRGAANFIPMHTYFEVRLKQMFLRNQREYFREFEPLASVTAEFQFAGERVQAPIVVGPMMLANVDKVSKGDHVEFLNIRLIGPCPYEGEDLKLFVGLFRIVTNDWSKRALNLLEILAKTFDSSRLSSFINISEPLADGLQGFIGMKDCEMRLGQYIQYTVPDIGREAKAGALCPCFEVYLRRPSSELDLDEQQKFWVNEGRLFYGESEEDLKEYTEADFVLLQIAPLDARHDYSGFNFHKKHWKKIEGLLAEQKNDDAFATFKLLAADLVQCDDIIPPHRISLLKGYRQKMDDNIALFEDLYAGKKREKYAMRGKRVSVPQELGETDLLNAVEAEVDITDFSPEHLIAQFTR